MLSPRQQNGQKHMTQHYAYTAITLTAHQRVRDVIFKKSMFSNEPFSIMNSITPVTVSPNTLILRLASNGCK